MGGRIESLTTCISLVLFMSDEQEPRQLYVIRLLLPSLLSWELVARTEKCCRLAESPTEELNAAKIDVLARVTIRALVSISRVSVH